MQNRAMSLEDYLNTLKQVFDRIEPYNIEDNIGFRSLKNIGVWLTAYALTDDKQKQAVVNELLELAALTELTDFTLVAGHIVRAVDYLTDPRILEQIIRNYEEANGKFTITVRTKESLAGIIARGKEVGMQDLVKKYCVVKPDIEADFVFEMNNTVKFNWSGKTRNGCVELQKGRVAEFDRVGKVKYMSTTPETFCSYTMVEFNSRPYHVSRISVVQQKDNGNKSHDSVYFIQPANPKDEATLQQDYLSVIKIAQVHRASYSDFQKVDERVKRAAPSNLKVTVSGSLEKDEDPSQVRVGFSATIHIPELVGTLKTKETRLGAYQVFHGKNIGNITAQDISYLGERELKYDEKGGEIKNKESFSASESMMRVPKINAHFDYTVSGPFVLAYYGHDTYAFKISDPTKNLEKSFDAKERYATRAQAGTMFSGSEKPEAETKKLCVASLK